MTGKLWLVLEPGKLCWSYSEQGTTLKLWLREIGVLTIYTGWAKALWHVVDARHLTTA